MASGIIYLAIIGMWVAYFLPRWIHSRNEFTGKSAQRYRSALEVVSGSASPLSEVDRLRAHQLKLTRRRLFFSLILTSFVIWKGPNLVGQITLGGVIYGALRGGHIGYWLSLIHI